MVCAWLNVGMRMYVCVCACKCVIRDVLSIIFVAWADVSLMPLLGCSPQHEPRSIEMFIWEEDAKLEGRLIVRYKITIFAWMSVSVTAVHCQMISIYLIRFKNYILIRNFVLCIYNS